MGRDLLSSESDVKIFTKSGAVIAVRIWGDTKTFGSVHNGQGSISSISSEKVRIFLKQENGKEFDVELTDPGMGFNESHHVSIVYCGHVRSDIGYAVGWMNHSTEKEVVREQLIENSLKQPVGFYWLIILCSPLVGCFAASPFAAAGDSEAFSSFFYPLRLLVSC